MENNERVWGNPVGGWNSMYSGAPNGLGFGFTYPGMMPFWGFGLEPNLWGDANIQGDYENPIMRNHMDMNIHTHNMNKMDYMNNQMKPIEMMYPKCFMMMYEEVMKECNMFIKNNKGIMPNKICKEEFCKMLENATMNIMNKEEMFIDKLKEHSICYRNSDLDESEIETRGNLGRYGNLLIGSMLGILMIQELRRRGCIYCY